jgi:hypothetical protein
MIVQSGVSVNGEFDKKKDSTARQELAHAVPESEIGK